MSAPAEARKADVDSVAAIIRRYYRPGETFTQNELRPILGVEGWQITPHGMGAVFQHLKRRGVIRNTWRVVRSTNPSSRGDVVAIWVRAS